MSTRDRRLPAGDDVRFDSGGHTPLVQAAVGLTVAALLCLGFFLLFSGNPYFWVVWAAGFAGVLPAVVGATKYYERRREDRSDRPTPEVGTGTTEVDGDVDVALQTLRERYARDEIDEETFERRLELLLETESVADAERHLRSRDRETERRSAGNVLRER